MGITVATTTSTKAVAMVATEGVEEASAEAAGRA
jgi:hypothetical protein